MFKILIAEDDRELRQLFQHVLLKNGYTVKGVSDGQEALNALEKDYYDLIISDIMMPNMDGYELVRSLRDAGDSIPVLMVTAKEAFDHAGLIYGMGHAVYTLSDPREVILKRFAQALAEEKGMTDEFKLYDKVEGIAGKLIMEHIRYGNILRIIIICIKSKYAALHGIHNVGIGSLHDNITYKTSSQIFHIREKFQEPGQLIFTWKFTEDQKIDRFLKAKTSVLQTVYDILYIDSLIIQFTVCRNTSAIDQLISGNIRNFSKTGKYTFTCRITKASFYIIFHIEIGINVVMLQQLLLKEFHSAFQLFGVLQTHHFMLFFHNLFLVSPLYIKKH